MSVMIRLTRVGKRGIRSYRIVVVPKTQKRNSAPLEILGSYVPGEKSTVNEKRLAYWQSVGAITSMAVRNLLVQGK